MSRVPRLERRVGSDVLARRHGRGGRLFVVLMLVHAAAAVQAWASGRGQDIGTALISALGLPWLGAATVSTVLFLVIAAISTWRTAHPFSLSAVPSHNYLRITVKALGDGRLIHAVQPGTLVLVEGPSGALAAQRRTRPSVLLIAGGVGITPMRALFESLPISGGTLTLLYRASTPRCGLPRGTRGHRAAAGRRDRVDDRPILRARTADARCQPAPSGAGHRRSRRLPLRIARSLCGSAHSDSGGRPAP
jgi:hypothetical protein